MPDCMFGARRTFSTDDFPLGGASMGALERNGDGQSQSRARRMLWYVDEDRDGMGRVLHLFTPDKSLVAKYWLACMRAYPVNPALVVSVRGVTRVIVNAPDWERRAIATPRFVAEVARWLLQWHEQLVEEAGGAAGGGEVSGGARAEGGDEAVGEWQVQKDGGVQPQHGGEEGAHEQPRRRANRRLRFAEKVSYKGRRRKWVVRSVVLALYRIGRQAAGSCQPADRGRPPQAGASENIPLEVGMSEECPISREPTPTHGQLLTTSTQGVPCRIPRQHGAGRRVRTSWPR